MDRGRMIDHTQNVNARQFDNFSKGKTSIKLFHPPGGEDHIQFGWDYNEPEELVLKLRKVHKNLYMNLPSLCLKKNIQRDITLINI